MRLPALLTLLLFAVPALADGTAVGRWKTVDDATGKAKSVVEIQRNKDGSLSGRVVELLDTSKGTDPVCDKCSGSKRNQPIKGMAILWGLKGDGAGKWSGGRVLDPENGKDYKAKLELLEDGRKLGMSGCIAFICRQQVWVRQ